MGCGSENSASFGVNLSWSTVDLGVTVKLQILQCSEVTNKSTEGCEACVVAVNLFAQARQKFHIMVTTAYIPPHLPC